VMVRFSSTGNVVGQLIVQTRTRRDLPALIRYAKQLGLRVNLITNGTTATRRRVRAWVRAGLDSAQVSLEGSCPEVHDRLTQVPGSFARTLRGLDNLRAAGLQVHTNTTINRVNAGDLLRLVDLLATLGLSRFSMNLVIPTGAASDPSLWVSYSEIGDLVQQVKREARERGLEFLWYSPTPYCLFNPLAHGLGNKGCAACDGLLSVAPNGDVLPCSSYPEPVGNLLRQPFPEVWHSSAACFHQSKQHAPPPCHGCEHFAFCQGACPLYWQARGWGELAAT